MDELNCINCKHNIDVDTATEEECFDCMTNCNYCIRSIKKEYRYKYKNFNDNYTEK